MQIKKYYEPITVVCSCPYVPLSIRRTELDQIYRDGFLESGDSAVLILPQNTPAWLQALLN